MSVPNFKNKKVLVVEDDDMSFLYLSQLLNITRATYKREKTGTAAIEQFIKNPDFDCILMDIQLPDLDGIYVTGEIRKLNNKIPVIGQTASRSVHELDQMLEAGCNAVLVKPFSMEMLFSELSKVLV